MKTISGITRTAIGIALAATAIGSSLPVAAARRPGGYTRNVAIVIYEGVELLDFSGPGEVFAAAAGFATEKAQPAFHVYTVAISRSPVTSQSFLKVTPDFSLEDAPRPDILVIPGGGTGALLRSPAFMAWAQKATQGTEVSMSVCTGAFVLGKLGLLDGAQATTWYGAIDRLRQDVPKATVIEGRRLVDNGAIITTAGVSAGIDGALHTVARLLGRYVADKTARYMEYHWTPEPYLAQRYSLLNPTLDDRGRRVQQGTVLEDERSFEQAAQVYRALLEQDPQDGSLWFRLGSALQAGGSLDPAIEANRHAAGFPEVRANALYNLARAHALKGQKEDALHALEEAVAAGFKAGWSLANDPDLAAIRTEPRFQKLLAALVKG